MASKRQGLSITTVLLPLILMVPIGLSAQQPELIPQPRELATKPEAFVLAENAQIVLAPGADDDDRFAAQVLAEEIQEDTGRNIPIVDYRKHSSKKPEILLGRLDQHAISNALEKEQVNLSGIGEQGYALDVSPKLIVVGGKDAAGLFYGVQTLRQLVMNNGEILGVSARDWPALETRGTQVDLARGPVPKLEYLERIVRTIAEFKMNALFMYIEDSFRVNGQPLIGLLSDTLTRDDWTKLIAYAKPYHVEIIPAVEACGHLHKILRFEQYSGLGERPHGHVLAANDPQALEFLNSFFTQLTTVFPSSTIHVGCDETFELGRGRSAAAVAQKGYGEVYVDNLIKIDDLVRRYNKQMMFWGDIAVEHPEMIPRLPKDLVVASWEYGYHASYDPWLKPFEGTGMKIFVCPWTGNTSLLAPDYEEAAANIEGFLTDGKKAGAIGMDVTVWNDDGESLYGPNWWSIVYGAACAWEPGATDVQTFNQKFDWAFFRDTSHLFVDSMMQLGHINEVIRAGGPVEKYDGRHGGADDRLFWIDPFTPLGNQVVEKDLSVAQNIRLAAEAAYSVFEDNAGSALRNEDVLEDLKLAALKIDALGMRIQYAREISDRYDDAVAVRQGAGDRRGLYGDFSDIDSTNGRLQDLRDYTTRLRELYRERWLAENLPNWLPNMLQLYDRNSQLWQELIVKFGLLRADLAPGKSLPPPDSLGLLPPATSTTPAAPTGATQPSPPPPQASPTPSSTPPANPPSGTPPAANRH